MFGHIFGLLHLLDFAFDIVRDAFLFRAVSRLFLELLRDPVLFLFGNIAVRIRQKSQVAVNRQVG